MEEKNKLIIEYIDRIRDEFLKRGHLITDETYQSIVSRFLNSDKPIEEIKTDIDLLVTRKIDSLKSAKEKERLKTLNIEDYQDVLLTIKSLDRRGYPNVISSPLKLYDKVGHSHNAPINVGFGNKNGFYKNSAATSSASLDKFEFVICQIGKMFGVKMAETYKVSHDNLSLGIISENVCTPNETLCMYSNIIKLLNVNNQKIQRVIADLEKLSSQESYVTSKVLENAHKIPMVNSEDDIKLVIDSFIEVTSTLKIDEEQKRNIRQDYFNMIMLDFVVNNVDRNKNNYGFIISEDGSVRFSPLFDNSTIDIPSMPQNYQQLNGFLISKQKLLDCLFTNYYDDIKGFSQCCAYNESQIIGSVESLCSKELNQNEQEWFLGEFTSNLHAVVKKELTKDEEQVEEQNLDVGPKLVRTKSETKNEETPPTNNEGKVNAIVLLLSISLMLILLTLIILFKIR